MLVLSRKQGERIVIGGNIVITVVSGGSDRVRLGISAPASIPIQREEICQRLNEANEELTVPGQSPFISECA